ncbi:MAG: PmoA family protein [bacterium]|nr:PmoA family protein [bacterium]
MRLPAASILVALAATAAATPALLAQSQGGASADGVITPNGHAAATIVRRPHDPDNHQATSKIFHHVFAPDGRRLTKGPGGLFGHHRGLFLGWNRTKFGGKRYDFWHCNRGETQRFCGFDAAAQKTLGKGWQVSRIEWRTQNDQLVIDESRAVRARSIAADEHAIDFVVTLRAPAGQVELAGDPQHAGQQFRALQAFGPDDAPKVTYLRPAGSKDHGNDVWTGCNWIAAVLPMPVRPVTVLRVESAQNERHGAPTWSTRNYGRFGATRKLTIESGKELTLAQTYVIALGERDAKWCAERAAAQSIPELERSTSTSR